jgi:hypothetical protein
VGRAVIAASDAQQRVLAALAPVLPADAYLAGGVAVAMRIGHRLSHDLDIFTTESDPQDLVEVLAAGGDARVTSRSEGTVYLEVSGVPVSIIRHRYPLLERAEHLPPARVPVASLADLTAMKLQAISTRGAARDFWDLHALLAHRGVALTAALAEHQRRYTVDHLGHVVRSLA